MEEEREKICFNCNSYFPDTLDEPTEYGICVNEEVFEPFLDELFENRKSAACRKLVEKRKFTGEKKACDNFAETEQYEIDDDSILGVALSRCIESSKLDTESIEQEIAIEKFNRIDWKSEPVDQFVEQLRSSDPDERDSGISSLAGYISMGNREAFNELFRYFRELSPPATIDEVHFKLEMLRKFNYPEFRTELIPELINELYRTESNNTTRQWISEIFNFLKLCPVEEVEEPLKNMLKDKRFSYRLKKKMKRILGIESKKQQENDKDYFISILSGE